MKLTEFLNEGNDQFVAADAYKSNVIKVQRSIEELKNHIADHIADFRGSNMQNWGPAGDMEHVYKRISELNEFLSKGNEF
jgi:hypothetical protein